MRRCSQKQAYDTYPSLPANRQPDCLSTHLSEPIQHKQKTCQNCQEHIKLILHLISSCSFAACRSWLRFKLLSAKLALFFTPPSPIAHPQPCSNTHSSPSSPSQQSHVSRLLNLQSPAACIHHCTAGPALPLSVRLEQSFFYFPAESAFSLICRTANETGTPSRSM